MNIIKNIHIQLRIVNYDVCVLESSKIPIWRSICKKVIEYAGGAAMFGTDSMSSTGSASSFNGVSMEGFRPVAFMRGNFGLTLPAGCKAGERDKAGLLFVNNTGQTQEIMVATELIGVPKFKTRITELIPRNTDIWVKGGQRFNYPLVAGLIYRFELNYYEQGTRKFIETPPERMVEISVHNSSTSHKTLYFNGETSKSVDIDAGKNARIFVPTGEIVLSFDSEDKPGSYYLIVRPQPAMTIEMM